MSNRTSITSMIGKTPQVDAGRRNVATLAMIAFCAFAVLPEMASAAPWDSMGTQVIAIFTGGLARSIAILAVIGCGVGAAIGRLQWSWAISIIVGIVLIFGATSIVDYFIAAAS